MELRKMTAQALYDFREYSGFCSGEDLHDFFRNVVGNPSPSGYIEIPTPDVKAFVQGEVRKMLYNSPSLVDEFQKNLEELHDLSLWAITALPTR